MEPYPADQDVGGDVEEEPEAEPEPEPEAEERNHMDLLPDELVVRIFSFVCSGAALLDSIPLVCKRFHRLSRHPLAWVWVEVTWVAGSWEEQSARLVSRAPALRSLTLDADWVDYRRAEAALRRSQVVVHDTLYVGLDFWWELPRAGRVAFLELMWRSRLHLRSLAMWLFVDDARQGLTDSAGHNTFHIMAHMHRLEEIEIEVSAGYPYDGEMAAGLPRLRVLRVHEFATSGVLPEGFIADLIRAAQDNLRVVKLSTHWTLTSTVRDLLAHCGSLEKLKADGSCLDTHNRWRVLKTLEVVVHCAEGEPNALDNAASLVRLALLRCDSLGPDTLRRLRLELDYFADPAEREELGAECEQYVTAFRARRPKVRLSFRLLMP